MNLKTGTIVLYAAILILSVGVIYEVSENRKQAALLATYANLEQSIQNIFDHNKALESQIDSGKKEKAKIAVLKQEIHNHFHNYYGFIRSSDSAQQDSILHNLVYEYRSIDKTEYIDSNFNREVNYRLAQGLEGIQISETQTVELRIDSAIMQDQGTEIKNLKVAVGSGQKQLADTTAQLHATTAELNKQTHRKKKWRAVAIWEGLALGGIIAGTILLLK